jgi:hypothetical protein
METSCSTTCCENIIHDLETLGCFLCDRLDKILNQQMSICVVLHSGRLVAARMESFQRQGSGSIPVPYRQTKIPRKIAV